MELEDAGFLEKPNVRLIGTTALTIKKAEDREMFKETMEKIGEPVAPSDIVEDVKHGLEVPHVVEDLAATCTQLAIMKKGSFLYSGSVSGLLENAKGCVWNCTVQNAEEARLLEANYSISSKQYVENGIHMKVLSKGKPNENCVLDNDITLEDAYIYLTNS